MVGTRTVQEWLLALDGFVDGLARAGITGGGLVDDPGYITSARIS